MKIEFDKKQQHVYDLLCEHDKYGVFLGAGSGKTRVVALRIKSILEENPKGKIYIFSTKGINLEVWPKELALHGIPFYLSHLDYQGPSVRSARVVISTFHQLVDMISYDYKRDNVLAIVVDESSLVKNFNSIRTKLVMEISQYCRYVYLLSGLPRPNHLIDLYTQIYCLDGGARLGKNITTFRRRWFTKGYSGFSYDPLPHAKKEIYKLIKDVCITASTEDFVPRGQLPEIKHVVERFNLSRKQLLQYGDFKRSSILQHLDQEVTAVTKGVLINKLSQYVSGNMYNTRVDYKDDGKPMNVRTGGHFRTSKTRRKFFRLMLKKHYKVGTPLIVAYSSAHSIPDIKKALLKHGVPMRKIYAVQSSGHTRANLEKLFTAQKIDVIICHPSSIGHGLNLQKNGGMVCFYQENYNYDTYYQIIRRIRRRGNPKKVTRVLSILCSESVDLDIRASLRSKENGSAKFNSVNRIYKSIMAKTKLQ